MAPLFQISIKLAQYDPNYIYAEDDCEMQEEGGYEGWGSDFDDEN